MGAVQIGLKNLVYALMTKDDSTGVAYSAPVAVPGVMAAKIDTKTSSETLFADDGPAEIGTAVGETSLELGLKELPLEVQAAWLGHSIIGGVMYKKTTDVAPYLAIGFMSSKSNGKNKYVWMLKGKFEVPSDD